MSGRAHGQLRRSQVITTFGPGALIDLPNESAIVGGLDTWGAEANLERIDEPRLAAKLQSMTGVPDPRLYAPPPEPEGWQDRQRGIDAWRFPEWFVVQEPEPGPGSGSGSSSGPSPRSRSRSRRLVPRTMLTNGRYEKKPVVATRFVRACSKGHVDDVDWRRFVHGPDDPCRQALWFDERGASGDLAEQIVRCDCGKSRRMHEAVDFASFPLGVCRGARPWLGRHANEKCGEPSRLLIRTASNAWFPQVVSVLSLPDRGSEVDQAVEALWDHLYIVKDANALAVVKHYPDVANRLASFSEDEVLDAIAARRSGGAAGERPIKHVELDALLAVPEGYGDDAPVDPDFHARRLPESEWRRPPPPRFRTAESPSDRTSGRRLPESAWRNRQATASVVAAVEAVIQVHRLREVLALAGFTRLEPVMPNVHGEYEAEVERADIALEPAWFPAVENRGEGILLQLRAEAVGGWLGRDPVKRRLDELVSGHDAWAARRKSDRPFPGGPYVLLHTLAHLLVQSLSMRCGYPAASVRERIYVDDPGERYALLLYTASPDAEGTLGGLVQEARRIEDHLRHALRSAALCSNDPVCAEHVPGRSMEERWLHGAACHGCTLIAETSCEMRNEYLDRALVAPTLGAGGAAFFPAP